MTRQAMSFAATRLSAVIAAFAFVATGLLAAPAHAGKLKDVRREVRRPRPSKTNTARQPRSNYQPSNSNDDGLGAIIALYIFTAPWWLPHTLTGDRFGRTYAFPAAPYANGIDGYVRFADMGHTRKDATGRAYLGGGGALRMRLESGWLGPDLSRLTVGGRLSSSQRIGLETEWTLYSEFLTGNVSDRLWLGDVNVSFIFAQNPWVQFHSGLGVRVMNDDIQTDVGFNFTYGLDLYVAKPVIISASIDMGGLGEAFVTHLKAHAGIILGTVEVYAGYDRIDVGRSVFGGPIIGIRSWH